MTDRARWRAREEHRRTALTDGTIGICRSARGGDHRGAMAIDRSREIDADGRRRDAMLDPRTDRRQRARNVVQSTLLLSSLLVVVAGIGWLLFTAAGLLWAVVLATVLLTLRPQIPPRLVLALYRAEPLPVAVAPDLHRLVGELAARAGLHHAPALYYVPSAALNCFCLGHGEDAALAVTDGLLRRLTYREVAGVLAHEVAICARVTGRDEPVRRHRPALPDPRPPRSARRPGCCGPGPDGDARLLLLCAALVALPVAVTLLQLALSRSREFEATSPRLG